jgi:hypothetical protein
MHSDHEALLAALSEFLAAFEAEYGEITEEEMQEAISTLRHRQPPMTVRPIQDGPAVAMTPDVLTS